MDLYVTNPYDENSLIELLTNQNRISKAINEDIRNMHFKTKEDIRRKYEEMRAPYRVNVHIVENLMNNKYVKILFNNTRYYMCNITIIRDDNGAFGG